MKRILLSFVLALGLLVPAEAARTFVIASSQKLSDATAIVAAAPLTLSCWFNTTNAALDQAVMTVADTASNDNFFVMYINGGTTSWRAQTTSAAASDNSNVGTVSNNTWHHGAGVWASTTSRTAYLDGTAGTTNTTSVSPASLDTVSVGNIERAAPTFYFGGRIAECGAWNAALTADEITMLSLAAKPTMVRPQNLIDYWPLYGQDTDEDDWIRAGSTLTVTGATAGDHPRMLGWGLR